MELSAFDRQVRTHIMSTLVGEGRAPSVPETALALGAGVNEVGPAYDRLQEGHVIVLAPGTRNVWMAHPLSAVPTPFTVEVGYRRWYGNCIWDALGVAAMLAADARIRTTCPDCGEAMTLRTDGDRIEGDGIAHFAVPAARWWENIGYT
jgi:hypothetical protein